MIVIVPRRTFVKTQVTVSPASTLNVAVEVSRLPLLGVALWPSSQTMAPRSHASPGSASVVVYGPGSSPESEIEPPSPTEPARSPLNEKLPAAPLGEVCFSTMIRPSWVFVKVQVTVSPGASAIAAGFDWSVHDAPVSVQPVATSSDDAVRARVEVAGVLALAVGQDRSRCRPSRR